VLKPDFILAIEKRIPIPGLPRPTTGPADAGGIIGGVLGRIFMMQIAIIFGAYVSLVFGSVAPLFILVVLKTVIDALLHIAMDVRPRARPAAALV